VAADTLGHSFPQDIIADGLSSCVQSSEERNQQSMQDTEKN
jgi:hypothetical protein